MRKFRSLLVLLVSQLPGEMRARLMKRLFEFDVHPSARIGLSLIDVNRLEMGPQSHIGHFNVFRHIDRLTLGESSGFGNVNWVAGEAHVHNPAVDAGDVDRDCLELGTYAVITHRHIIDVAGGVSIGSYAALAGYNSQILTHSINLEKGRQELGKVCIGDYCFIGTASVLLPGASVPGFSVLGACSVLAIMPNAEPYCVYWGVPARPIKKLNKDNEFFLRTEGIQ
jgi:acetyltransferase-like isoleucine patch superfamily enzyme